MDDFIILSNDRAELEAILEAVEAFLRGVLGLELNPKTQIFKTDKRRGIDFCGYVIWEDHRKVRKSSVRRMRRAIKAFRRGKITVERLMKALRSWAGHISHADARGLRRKIFAEVKAALKGGGAVGNGRVRGTACGG